MIKKFSEITDIEMPSKLKHQKRRKGDVRRHLADISHARKVLGPPFY